MNRPIYLDYNATTPIDPRVLEAMLPYLGDRFGNPSSGHVYGHEAREAIENARKELADLLGCDPEEIIFTSGGTESNNLVLFGVVQAIGDKGRHIVTTKIEHPAIIEPCLELFRRGFDISFVPVDNHGLVDPDDIRKALQRDTILISVMHANNEVGTIQPLSEISGIAKEREILFHTDAAQSVGKIPTNVRDLGVDFLTVAGHKLYAPKGIGALYRRRGAPLERIIFGAGQERGIRPGTENVPYIVGLGKAASIAGRELKGEMVRLASLRDELTRRILENIPYAVVHGLKAPRLPNTLSIAFPGKRTDEILKGLPNVAASAGAACHSHDVKISHVLEAMGVSPEVAMGTIRLSLGRFTTEEEVILASEEIVKALNKR
ncbi:MAG: cysteine desulfurase [Syntrophobacterales bacterium]|nr:cysteine desulfurase [Syntrophobacterales bacterium]